MFRRARQHQLEARLVSQCPFCELVVVNILVCVFVYWNYPALPTDAGAEPPLPAVQPLGFQSPHFRRRRRCRRLHQEDRQHEDHLYHEEGHQNVQEVQQVVRQHVHVEQVLGVLVVLGLVKIDQFLPGDSTACT